MGRRGASPLLHPCSTHHKSLLVNNIPHCAATADVGAEVTVKKPVDLDCITVLSCRLC